MKLEKMSRGAKDIYTVKEISPDDIARPSEHFLKVTRELSGFSFLNTFTMDEFMKQVRQRFTHVKR